MTVLVGKLEHPKTKVDEQNSTVACPVTEKGTNDVFVLWQLKNFIRMHGIKHLVFKSDQERSLVAFLENVAADLRKEGMSLILEQSPVGESQSNGVAERQIQAVEDLLRTMRGALMHRLQTRIVATHPLFQWLILHVASVMNRFVVGRDGKTAFQRLHGRRASSKAVEFGERVFYYIPRKLRAKMSLRWRLGMYLGVASHSGEHLIGTWNGDVVRTRSIIRVVESAGWTLDLADRLKRTPAHPTPSGNTAYENVEKNEDPPPWLTSSKLMIRRARLRTRFGEGSGLPKQIWSGMATLMDALGVRTSAAVQRIPLITILKTVGSECMANGKPTMILSGFSWGNTSRANTLELTFKKGKLMLKGIKGFLKLLPRNPGRLKSDRRLLIMSP